MKIVRINFENEPRYGVLHGKEIHFLEDLDDLEEIGPAVDLNHIRLLAPCQPSKIIAMGLNYYSHAKEMGHKIPNSPLTFLKPSTAVIGPEANIIYPSISSRVDYEGELAVVIAKTAWRVPKNKVSEYILGYTCFNDITARDLQQTDNQWTRAKGFDTFAAIGPWIETELDPSNLSIETFLNGQIKQRGNTSDLIYTVAEIVNFISHVMTLLPGDVIATGTPAGIGPMQPGDKVEVRISGIGTLRNYVIANGF